MSAEELAALVLNAVEATWLAAPTESFYLSVGVVPAAKPDGARMSDWDIERFPDAGAIVDDDGGTADGSFGFTSAGLERRFGPRP